MNKAMDCEKENLAERLSHILDERGELSEHELLGLGAWLARRGSAQGLRVLGLRGGLCAARDDLGMDLLSWAARGGDEECLLLAGEVCFSGAVDIWGGGALHHWAESKRPGPGVGAQILLALGVGAAERDCWGMLPMHWSQDHGVWSWSMAALWAKDDPEGWRSCGGVDAMDATEACGVLGLREWAGKLGDGSFLKARRPRRPAAASGAILDEKLANLLTGIEIRRKKIGDAATAQNCIAQRLGIEYGEIILGAAALAESDNM